MGQATQPLSGLDGEELLRAWESAAAADSLRRGVAMLAAVLPDLPDPSLLPLGSCDTLLLALHVGTFGPSLAAVASCPSCAEPVDVEADGAAILAGLPAVEPAVPAEEQLIHGEYSITFRLPTIEDLVAAADAGDVDTARERIARRCLLAATRGGAPVDIASLLDDALAAVSARMADADAAADLRLRLTCPACATEWSAPLHVAALFHAEVTGAAMALLAEVDELAARYGWTERDILALTPTRRRTYLELR